MQHAYNLQQHMWFRKNKREAKAASCMHGSKRSSCTMKRRLPLSQQARTTQFLSRVRSTSPQATETCGKRASLAARGTLHPRAPSAAAGLSTPSAFAGPAGRRHAASSCVREQQARQRCRGNASARTLADSAIQFLKTRCLASMDSHPQTTPR